MTQQMYVRSSRKTWLQLAAFFFLALALTYGFPVTGDDWFFTLRRADGNLLHALRIGYDTAAAHAQTTNGRYLGNFLAGAMGTSKLLRELVRGGCIFGVFLAACRFCGLRRGWERLVCMALLVAVPADIYAETYAWAAGFFNYVPPALLVLLYLNAAAGQFERGGRAPAWQTPALFLLGLASQFFVENVTVALCLLSLGLCILCRVRQGRFAPQLAAHALGALLGGVLMLLAPGYRNVGAESYREIPSGLSGMLTNAIENFGVIVNKLMLKNWQGIGLLTLLCALLLRRADPAPKRAKKLAAFALTAATAGLVLCPMLLPPLMAAGASAAGMAVQLLLALAVLLWLVGVTVAIWVGVPEKTERLRALLPLGAAVLFLAPLLAVHPIGPRCLYLPDVLLLCAALRVGRLCCCRPALPRLARRCVCLCACAVLAAFLFMMVENGRFEAVRVAYTEQQIAAGATQITLPDYPYADYVYGEDSKAIESYYYRDAPGDIPFALVPYEAWSP